jgi:hypothetical protein
VRDYHMRRCVICLVRDVVGRWEMNGDAIHLTGLFASFYTFGVEEI